MAQKPQALSQPSATFTYAHGADAGGRGRLSRSKLGRARPDGLAPEGDGHTEAGDGVHLGQSASASSAP